MSRGCRIKPRSIKPDYVFKSKNVAKLIRKIMWHGKLSVASKIVYNAFEIISSQYKLGDPLSVFETALENLFPTVVTKPRRVGGAIQHVPVEVGSARALVLAMQWLIASARARTEKNMSERLAGEIVAAYQNTGAAIKKKDDNQKMAKSNNLFASV